jgi:hypothetical protein
VEPWPPAVAAERFLAELDHLKQRIDIGGFGS